MKNKLETKQEKLDKLNKEIWALRHQIWDKEKESVKLQKEINEGLL